MRVTVYLPDDLRKQAKDAGINLSDTLRRAVEAELSGEAAPSVRIERAGRSVELHVSVHVDMLREHTK